MHVYAGRGTGVMLVAKPKLVHHAHLSEKVRRQTQVHIHAHTCAHTYTHTALIFVLLQVVQVDPPSKDILWQRLTGISMDLALGDVSDGEVVMERLVALHVRVGVGVDAWVMVVVVVVVVVVV